MAAAVARGGVAVLRRSSLLTSYNFLIHKNLCLRTGVLWKQPPSRTFFNDRKKLHTAPLGQVFRLRPFHILVATGGGYAGYKKYEDYKLEQLEKRGIEVPVKLASEWEVRNLGQFCFCQICCKAPLLSFQQGNVSFVLYCQCIFDKSWS